VTQGQLHIDYGRSETKVMEISDVIDSRAGYVLITITIAGRRRSLEIPEEDFKRFAALCTEVATEVSP
jgi:hypothetical protein